MEYLGEAWAAAASVPGPVYLIVGILLYKLYQFARSFGSSPVSQKIDNRTNLFNQIVSMLADPSKWDTVRDAQGVSVEAIMHLKSKVKISQKNQVFIDVKEVTGVLHPHHLKKIVNMARKVSSEIVELKAQATAESATCTLAPNSL